VCQLRRFLRRRQIFGFFSARKRPNGIKLQSCDVHYVKIYYARFHRVVFWPFLQSFIEFNLFNFFYNTTAFATTRSKNTYVKTLKSYIFCSLYVPIWKTRYMFSLMCIYLDMMWVIIQENVILLGSNTWPRRYGGFGNF
jgi:hypothetical protein